MVCVLVHYGREFPTCDSSHGIKQASAELPTTSATDLTVVPFTSQRFGSRPGYSVPSLIAMISIIRLESKARIQSLLAFSSGPKRERPLLHLRCTKGNAAVAGLLVQLQQYKNGVCTAEEYPFTGEDQKCVPKFSSLVRIGGCQKVVVGDRDLMRAVSFRPCSASLSPEFQNSVDYLEYKGGIFYGSSGLVKLPQGSALGHTVLIVGYDSEKGQKFFIIKESKGKNWWGEGRPRSFRTRRERRPHLQLSPSTLREKLLGVPAKQHAMTDPTNIIFGIKRLIGRRYDDGQTLNKMNKVPYKIVNSPNGDAWVDANGNAYSPSQIGAFLLTQMKEIAEAYLIKGVSKAVISVPAYFNDSQRRAKKDAGTIAGLDVQSIINESTSAALSYAFNKKMGVMGLVAVFDLGGGTFHVSILEISTGVFEVKATNGDTFLGGQRLREAAERDKIKLSSASQTEIVVPCITAHKDFNIIMTRSKFESLEDIEEVLLVGGMTRVPKVQEVVSEIFGKRRAKGVHPEEAVAMGAAIQGDILRGVVKDIVFVDITPLSLGCTETLSGIFNRLINKNTTIPTKRSQKFSTTAENQTQVGVRVLQGENEMASDNILLGEFVITGIPPAPRGLPQIEVTFQIDVNGIVTVSARDMPSGKRQQVTVKSCGGLLESEIEEMVSDAEKVQERKSLMDIKNIADTSVCSMNKSLSECQEKIPAEVVKEMEDAISDLRHASAGDNVDEIKAKLDIANKAMSKIRQQMGPKTKAKADIPAKVVKEMEDVTKVTGPKSNRKRQIGKNRAGKICRK
ncbi:hypothetical protein C5167_007934 [Papaver somniferum]|uniref:Peptidase C1A papain C-terminal domain-containing protein n=1 Tax=Papaver somniferum TaxID=3469 RepID=A0A4Y7JT15_PAPSO|nr:hypothetical protein C5167_007934 [Papaver somniferum]